MLDQARVHTAVLRTLLADAATEEDAARTRLDDASRRTADLAPLVDRAQTATAAARGLTDAVSRASGIADRLARLLKGIPAKVNLLAWNEVPGLPHKRPDDSVVMRFKDRLVAHHMTVFFRTSRGRDVMAACGMLGESVQ
jgi:hypothetical protein